MRPGSTWACPPSPKPLPSNSPCPLPAPPGRLATACPRALPPAPRDEGHARSASRSCFWLCPVELAWPGREGRGQGGRAEAQSHLYLPSSRCTSAALRSTQPRASTSPSGLSPTSVGCSWNSSTTWKVGAQGAGPAWMRLPSGLWGPMEGETHPGRAGPIRPGPLANLGHGPAGGMAWAEQAEPFASVTCRLWRRGRGEEPARLPW